HGLPQRGAGAVTGVALNRSDLRAGGFFLKPPSQASSLDQNVLAVDLHPEASNRDAGIVEILASRNIVLPTMPWTGHMSAVQFAFRDGTAAVLAVVPDCVVFPARVEYGDLLARGLHHFAAT